MNGKLKVLGLALLATFAMSAVAASAAQAQEAELTTTSNEYPVVLTGTEEGGSDFNFFETTPGTRLHCESTTYEGTLTDASSELTVTPHYTGCKSTSKAGTVPATIDLNTCHYVFTAGTMA